MLMKMNIIGNRQQSDVDDRLLFAIGPGFHGDVEYAEIRQQGAQHHQPSGPQSGSQQPHHRHPTPGDPASAAGGGRVQAGTTQPQP